MSARPKKTAQRKRARTSGAPSGRPAAERLRLELDIHREELSTQNDDLRRSNAALLVANERYAELYDGAPVAYFTLDAAGRVIEANTCGAELFGAHRSLLFGRVFDELVTPPARQAFRRFRERVIKDGGRPVHPTVLATSERRFPARIAAARIGDPSSETACALLCIADETARQADEQERRHLHAQVAEALRVESLGMLAGGVAHDFNNLLSIVLAYAELGLVDEATPPPLAAFFEAIRAAATRAAALSSQMLAYTGVRRVEAAVLDLSGVIGAMRPLLESAAPSAKLVLELADELPPVAAERALVQQITLNLVVNAAEALGERGVITVRTGAVPGGEGVFLEVADDGPGMDEATRRRAFDPFFSTKAPGRGLGLAVVHGNARAHGGAVTVESSPGQGARFRVALPVVGGNGALVAADAARDLDPVRKKGEVLVVDDEEGVRRVLGRMIERLGFEVSYAADGVEAVELVRRGLPGLSAVLLDLTMPGPDGRATLAELKALAPSLPVVLMSGFASAGHDASLARSSDGFVAKPFTLAAIRFAIEDAIRRRPSAPAAGGAPRRSRPARAP